jgi:hypothetical protein
MSYTFSSNRAWLKLENAQPLEILRKPMTRQYQIAQTVILDVAFPFDWSVSRP